MSVDAMVAPVLDKGFIRIEETWGSDDKIVRAARVSYTVGGNARKKTQDEKLLYSLLRDKHMSPFGHAGMTLHVKCPLFVADQWLKHDSFFEYSMISGRYVKQLPDERYEPATLRLPSTDGNHQGSGPELDPVAWLASTLTGEHSSAAYLLQQLSWGGKAAHDLYLKLIDHGVERGIARIGLPVSQYTEFWASGSVRGWLHFLEFRDERHAQSEIRQYAEVIAGIMQHTFPWTYGAYEEYIKEGTSVPKTQWERIVEATDWQQVFDGMDLRQGAWRDLKARVLEIRPDAFGE